MTTEQEPQDETTQLQSRVSELETELLIARAEIDQLRPHQVESNIRRAGFDPDSTGGRVLAELAGKDDTLGRDYRRLAEKAEALGLTNEPGSEPEPVRTGPQSDPDDVASRLARRDQSRRQKSVALASMLSNATAETGADEVTLRPSRSESGE